MRVLHFSDVHLDPPFGRVPWKDWLGKRALAGAAYRLVRRRDFADVPRKLGALDRFRREQEVDLVIFTGDATMFGTEPELAAARAALEPFMDAALGFVAVPGNHDFYLGDGVRERRWERRFGETAWPLVLFPAADLAVVALCSARPNPVPWRSSGRIPAAQIDALRRLVGEGRLAGRFVFVLTHHAPRRGDGTPDRPQHGLDNADPFLEACAPIAHGAILFGHIHHGYRLRVPGVGPELFNAGSATHHGREHAWLFDVEAGEATAASVRWDGEGWVAAATQPRGA